MEEEIENLNEQVDGFPVRSETLGFRPEQMSACGKCGKANPPNRSQCLYCAAELDVAPEYAAEVKLKLHPLEDWEPGHNVVVLPGLKSHSSTVAEKIASVFGLNIDLVKVSVSSPTPTPLMRVESEAQSETARERLEIFGIRAAVVSDRSLKSDVPPVRLRGLEFENNKLKAIPFNTTGIIDLSAEQIVLIVTGAIFELKTEATMKRKKKETLRVDEMQTSTDLPVVDFYAKDESTGFRITVNGFDFSCLGDDKGMLAAENLAKLVKKLKTFSTNVVLIEDYISKRNLLDVVWEPKRSVDSKGIHSAGFGKVAFATGSRTSNVQQFTKYSRLQMGLL